MFFKSITFFFVRLNKLINEKKSNWHNVNENDNNDKNIIQVIIMMYIKGFKTLN